MLWFLGLDYCTRGLCCILLWWRVFLSPQRPHECNKPRHCSDTGMSLPMLHFPVSHLCLETGPVSSSLFTTTGFSLFLWNCPFQRCDLMITQENRWIVLNGLCDRFPFNLKNNNTWEDYVLLSKHCVDRNQKGSLVPLIFLFLFFFQLTEAPC